MVARTIFCNKKVRELTEKSEQYFSYVFHNGFRFDITFLTKGLWLSLGQTLDVSLLGSGLTTLKSYTLGRYVKFVDSIKYYRQPLPKLARSFDANENKRIRGLFLDYLAYTHPYYSKYRENIEYRKYRVCSLVLALWKRVFSLRSSDGFRFSLCYLQKW